MSDVFTKPHPMIDLDEFERRLRPLGSGGQNDGDVLLAELSRIIGHKDAAHETGPEPATQLSARPRQDREQRGEGKQPGGQDGAGQADSKVIEAALPGRKRPDATVVQDAENPTAEYKPPRLPGPLIGGNFAAIEAGLLSDLRDQTAKLPSEPVISKGLLTRGLEPERRVHQDDQGHGCSGSSHLKSPRRLYVTAAIIIAGMAGLAVNFGLSSPSETASIQVDNGERQQQPEVMSTADVPAQTPANLNKAPAPMALVNGTGPSSDLPQGEEKTPAVESHPQIDNESAAAPAVPAQRSTREEPSFSAPDEPDTAKTGLSTPDGAQLAGGGTPPQADVNRPPVAAPQSLVATNAPATKSAARKVRPQKSATTRHPTGHNPRRQLANQAASASEPAPSGDPKAEALRSSPPTPGTSGPLGLVQSAVNTFTSTTAKLFDWGRN